MSSFTISSSEGTRYQRFYELPVTVRSLYTCQMTPHLRPSGLSHGRWCHISSAPTTARLYTSYSKVFTQLLQDCTQATPRFSPNYCKTVHKLLQDFHPTTASLHTSYSKVFTQLLQDCTQATPRFSTKYCKALHKLLQGFQPSTAILHTSNSRGLNQLLQDYTSNMYSTFPKKKLLQKCAQTAPRFWTNYWKAVHKPLQGSEPPSEPGKMTSKSIVFSQVCIIGFPIISRT